MALIETKNLTKLYGDGATATPALQGVSLSIEKGKFIAIMGPSGSGKSTLLHILGFLDDYTAGEYRFSEKTVGEYNEHEKARIRNERMGFVFQAFNLLPKTSVLENVKLPLRYSKVPEALWTKKAEAAVRSVGLSERILHEPSELSGGEKQRAAIARALVGNPDIIFADEPTGNLDSRSGQAIMEILQRLNKEHGHTIILITHETDTAEHADRIIKLRDGKIESDTKLERSRNATKEFVNPVRTGASRPTDGSINSHQLFLY